MIASGFRVYGGEMLEALRTEAGEWLQKPSPLTPEQDVTARYLAATLLEDGEDVMEGDPAMASALLAEAMLAMLRYHLRARNGVIPGKKSQLLELERSDPVAAGLTRDFFAAADFEHRLVAARAFADRTVRARGFFEWDSERIPVPLD